MIQVGILTVSDACARGEREDESGRVAEELCAARGLGVAVRAVVPDEGPEIARTLMSWIDERDLPVVLTTGGTGLTPRDVTPEATLAVVEREVPGIAERLRATGWAHTPHAALSRGVAGTRGRSLVVNLPGSPSGVRESLETLLPLLPHAVELLRHPERGHEAHVEVDDGG